MLLNSDEDYFPSIKQWKQLTAVQNMSSLDIEDSIYYIENKDKDENAEEGTDQCWEGSQIARSIARSEFQVS